MRITNLSVRIPYALMVRAPRNFSIAAAIDSSSGRLLQSFMVTSVAAWGATTAVGDLRILVDGGLRFCWPLADLCRRYGPAGHAQIPDAMFQLSRHMCSEIIERLTACGNEAQQQLDVQYVVAAMDMLSKMSSGLVQNSDLRLQRAIQVDAGEELSLAVSEGSNCNVLLSGLMTVDALAKWSEPCRSAGPPSACPLGSEQVAPESS